MKRNLRTGAAVQHMVDWEITAKTVYCDAVHDEVTFLVNAEGVATCTGRQKYAGNRRKTGCITGECDELERYRKSLLGGDI